MNKIQFVMYLLSAASDSDLLLSRKNCHVKGLHSIVLYKDNFDRLLRLYFTTPDHQLYNCMDDRVVVNLGVHNHRYDLHLTSVHGEATNVEYLKTQFELQYKTKVQSYLFRDRTDVVECGDVFLSRGKTQKIENLFLGKDELHTVYVKEQSTASWLVQEGFKQRDYTMLYTNKPVQCEQHDSFQSASDVRSFVTQYYSNKTSR